MERPNWLTKTQLQILMRYVPGPLGKGMSIKQTAADMRLNAKTVKRSLQVFKKRFPDGWARIQVMRRGMNAHRIGLRSAGSLQGLFRAVGREAGHAMIKDFPTGDHRPAVEIAIEREENASK